MMRDMIPLPSAEFGLPVYAQTSGQSVGVREISEELQLLVQHASDSLGGPGVLGVPLLDLVAVFRGWPWLPSSSACPVGQLRYEGSGPLPSHATRDFSAATSAYRPSPVVCEDLSSWQQVIWGGRPLNSALFDALLSHDVDREFLLSVVQHGIMLVPDPGVLQPFDVPNYASAADHASQVSVTLSEELQQGWVAPVDEGFSPFVHPIGVVPKGSGGIRIIHDHSVPVGLGLNDHQIYVRLSYDSLESALPFVVPRAFMARLDISSYYRHFPIHPSQWGLQCFRWDGQLFVDSRLQFGARSAPEIAHRFTMFLKRVLYANGLRGMCCVMDDFLFLHCSREVCRVMLAVAVALLQDLGFVVNLKPGKTDEPARVQKFLGVMVNTARMSLSLPADKLAATLSVASSLLARRSCKVRHLQSLLGRLQWASRVVYGGKAFMRSLSDALVGARHPSHHVSISASMKADLMWWLQFASAHNGLLRLSPAVSTHIVYTDACLAPIPCVGIFSAGAFAAFTARQLASFDDVPLVVDVDNINLWECLAVYMALAAYPEVFSTSRVVVYCDNAATVAWVSGGSPKSAPARPLIQSLFALCVRLHVRLVVAPIEGVANVLADAVSRRQWARFGPAAAAALSCQSSYLLRVLPSMQASP